MPLTKHAAAGLSFFPFSYLYPFVAKSGFCDILRISVDLTPARFLERRALADDRYAFAVARVGEVVPDGVVLGYAVVPEGQRAGRPAYAALEFDVAFEMPPEKLQERIAFLFREFVDAGREAAIDEECELAAVRVADDGRMHSVRPAAIGTPEAVAADVKLGAVMRGGETFDDLLHR